MNNEFNLPPPHENGYPFLMDDKVLEQIGFAVAGCKTVTAGGGRSRQ